jgi:hypothetical protein
MIKIKPTFNQQPIEIAVFAASRQKRVERVAPAERKKAGRVNNKSNPLKWFLQTATRYP